MNPPVRRNSVLAEGASSLVASRQCGDCRVCCAIYELDAPNVKKDAGVLCPHHRGGGCSIYAARPQACRDFFCLWRRLEAFSDDLRPDRCGVLFRMLRVEQPRIVFESFAIVAQSIDHDPDSFERQPVKGALKLLADDGRMPIWTSVRGVKSLYYPTLPFVDAVLRPTTTPWQSLVPLALGWLHQYEAIISTFI
jgi:hypothetical protein